MRLLPCLAAFVAAAAILAGCGGKKETSSTSTPSATTSAAANTAYERSYSDCSSNRLIDLAHKYNVKSNREAVATAVGKYWANRAGGGADAVAAGKAGCKDGFPLAPK